MSEGETSVEEWRPHHSDRRGETTDRICRQHLTICLALSICRENIISRAPTNQRWPKNENQSAAAVERDPNTFDYRTPRVQQGHLTLPALRMWVQLLVQQ